MQHDNHLGRAPCTFHCTMDDRPRGPNGDDADARGEHKYGTRRSAPRKITAEDVAQQRQPGHYVAGAEGTQDVAEPTNEQPKPTDSPPGLSGASRRCAFDRLQ